MALERSLRTLHHVFRRPHLGADFGHAAPVMANTRDDYACDIVVCTTGEDHVLAQLGFPRALYQHVATRAAPLRLGFECRAVLRDALGRYDWFCFLEDDVIVTDPWLFDKLRWFSGLAGERSVLLPNRCEMPRVTADTPVPTKVYIDMELSAEATADFQDLTDVPEIAADHLGTRLVFHRPRNPHAACYFLSQAQLAYWVGRPDFMDRETIWMDPLVTAATLGPMRAFRLYKPAAANADFLEVLHHGDVWARRLVKAGRKAGMLD